VIEIGQWWSYKKGTAMRLALDDQGSDELDKAFAEFVAMIEKTAAESEARIAETGAEVRPVLFSEDRENRRLALVPLDDASEEEAPTFASELAALTEEWVTREIDDFQYLIQPDPDGWTVREKDTGCIVGEPHRLMRDAIRDAIRLNRGMDAPGEGGSGG